MSGIDDGRCAYTPGCDLRGTHYCKGQEHGVEPGLPMKYTAAKKRIAELEVSLKAETDLRHAGDRTIARIEGARASWEGRAKAAEADNAKMTEDVLRLGREFQDMRISLEAAQARIKELEADSDE